ncbi:MAG: polyketide cyclase [Planctomycetaceae bacterium]|nr:MAG: polyketide cyclase [Planctomycetaceae bacterium]
MMIPKGSAPLVATSKIEISTDPKTVWEILTDFERWPSWMPDVKSMSFSGRVQAGSGFRWKAGSWTINSTIRRVEPYRLIAWTGEMIGIEAVHFWHLEDRNGTTLVTTEESWGGLLPRLLRGPLRNTLAKSLESGLQALKVQAERRATPGATTAA